jgi:hypothetical protein
MQSHFEDRADVFAPVGMAPHDPIFQGWPAGRGTNRPL